MHGEVVERCAAGALCGDSNVKADVVIADQGVEELKLFAAVGLLGGFHEEHRESIIPVRSPTAGTCAMTSGEIASSTVAQSVRWPAPSSVHHSRRPEHGAIDV